MASRLPAYLEKYFWNVSSERLNKEGNSRLTIERLLECGNEKAVRWLCRNYIGSEIMPLLKESRAFTFLKNVFSGPGIFSCRRSRCDVGKGIIGKRQEQSGFIEESLPGKEFLPGWRHRLCAPLRAPCFF